MGFGIEGSPKTKSQWIPRTLTLSPFPHIGSKQCQCNQDCAVRCACVCVNFFITNFPQECKLWAVCFLIINLSMVVQNLLETFEIQSETQGIMECWTSDRAELMDSSHPSLLNSRVIPATQTSHWLPFAKCTGCLVRARLPCLGSDSASDIGGTLAFESWPLSLQLLAAPDGYTHLWYSDMVGRKSNIFL